MSDDQTSPCALCQVSNPTRSGLHLEPLVPPRPHVNRQRHDAGQHEHRNAEQRQDLAALMITKAVRRRGIPRLRTKAPRLATSTKCIIFVQKCEKQLLCLEITCKFAAPDGRRCIPDTARWLTGATRGLPQRSCTLPLEVGISLREFFVAARLKDVAVRYDHALEVPLENLRDRFARGFAVANRQPNQAMRSELAPAANHRIEDAAALEIRRHVEDQVREYSCPARPMKKYHLVQLRRALEQVLLDLARPLGLRLVAQRRVELQIAPRAAARAKIRDVSDQARRPVQLRA